ncbi:MAG TPA: glycosyltransferase family 39 protein [bacterium]
MGAASFQLSAVSFSRFRAWLNMQLKRLKSFTVILALLAAVKFLLPFLINDQFEFHRDELLYLAMADHLDWGYLEVPPFIAAVAKVARFLFGDSELAARFFPALTGALCVLLTAFMARELGGGRFAQVLAAIAFIMAPAYLRTNVLFQPVGFDQLFFMLAAYLAIRLLQRENGSDMLKHVTPEWILLGLVTGFGLLNKYTMLLFPLGFLLGLLLTSQRKLLASRWPWLAGGLALLVVSPNLIWQYLHGWPIFEHLATLSRNQLTNVEPVGFLLMQLLMSFMAFPVWIIGLCFLLFCESGKSFRAIGWMYLAILVLLLLLSGKAYYLLPAYPMLFAGGAVAIEKYAGQPSRGWLRPALIGFLIVANIGTMPYGVPMLSIQNFEIYAKFMAENLGLAEPLRWEDGQFHRIPQDYADMLGWENQAATVAKVFQQLSPAEQTKCSILASNYGEAGAIDFYARKYQLPGAIAYNGSYYLWGPGDARSDILITLGIDREDLLPYFASVVTAAVITHEYARETGVPVNVCRNSNITLSTVWPRLARERY